MRSRRAAIVLATARPATSHASTAISAAMLDRPIRTKLSSEISARVSVPSTSTNSGTAALARPGARLGARSRSEEHTSELQSLMSISYAVFCLKQNNNKETDEMVDISYRHKTHGHN